MDDKILVKSHFRKKKNRKKAVKNVKNVRKCENFAFFMIAKMSHRRIKSLIYLMKNRLILKRFQNKTKVIKRQKMETNFCYFTKIKRFLRH